MYFTTRSRVDYPDCDSTGRMKISAAMKRMQQTSSEHLEYLGMPPEKLLRENMVFLLSKLCIKVHRMPVCAEELAVGTAPTSTRGARFVREFVIDSPGGERLVSAFSLWLLVNPESRRILRPASFPYPIPFQETGLEAVIDDVALPKNSHSQGTVQVPVRYSHIDTNGHVNNTVYADFVCDVLPYEQLCENGIDTLVLSFQNEAKWGEVIDLSLAALGGEEYYISGVHGAAACFEALCKLNRTSP